MWLRDLLGLRDAPHTMSELVVLAAARGRPPLERLLALSPTPHRVRWDGRQDYTPCVLDALMLPFLLDADAVEGETTTPVDRVRV